MKRRAMTIRESLEWAVGILSDADAEKLARIALEAGNVSFARWVIGLHPAVMDLIKASESQWYGETPEGGAL
jgi:hypothetical protein